LPPLERVFDAINVKKSDLMGLGKQMGIFEAMKKSTKTEKIFEDSLEDADGMICNGCNNIFERIPLTGKCNFCGGEIVFYKGDKKSRKLELK
jgi:hypothetical protein